MSLVERNYWWRKFSRIKCTPNVEQSIYEKLCNYLALMVFRNRKCTECGYIECISPFVEHPPARAAVLSTVFSHSSLVFSVTNQKWGQFIKYLLIRASIKCLLNAFPLWVSSFNLKSLLPGDFLLLWNMQWLKCANPFIYLPFRYWNNGKFSHWCFKYVSYPNILHYVRQ